MKIAAERLLDRAKVRKGAPTGAALVEMADGAGIDVIATDVQSEEDAVSLIDMGVDLMTGERLSRPAPPQGRRRRRDQEPLTRPGDTLAALIRKARLVNGA